MASLSGNKSTGGTNWDFYVVKSQNYDLEIEHGESTPLYDDRFQASKTVYQEKTKLKVLSPKLVQRGPSQFAYCQIASKKGYVAISKIRKPSKAGLLGTLQDEQQAITALNALFEQHKRPITIDILDAKGRIFLTAKDCIGARKIDGTPKADFVIHSASKEEIFISHKAAGGAKAFQQYSGVSMAAGTTISKHKEVNAFLKKLTKYVGPKGLKSPCIAAVRDPNLIGYSVFGPDFKKSFGINNVHIVAQGLPRLEPRGKSKFSLMWSDSYVINGELSELCEDYTPVLGATFRSGRAFDFSGKTYRGARVAIYPVAIMKGRTGLVTFK